jgi:hypothetical protein
MQVLVRRFVGNLSEVQEIISDVLGNGQNAFQSIEMDPVGGISSNLDLAGLGAESSDNVADRATLLKLGKHQRTVCGSLP